MIEARPDDIAPHLIELLAWYGEAGCDAVLDEAPTDWRDRREGPGVAALARLRSGAVTREPVRVEAADAGSAPQGRSQAVSPSAAPPATRAQQAPGRLASAPSSPASQGERRFPGITPSDATADARRLAASAGDLDALRAVLESFDGCALKATAKSLCFYHGAAQARVMVIGEAPGRDEDVAGRLVVGAAGELLERMLAAIGLGAADVHITNAVYWRPPGNRTPTPQETEICRPFLDRQIALVAPEIVLLLGGVAANAILGGEQKLMSIRGHWQDVELGGARRRLLPSLPPSFLLKTPAYKRHAWRDLLAVKLALVGSAGGE